MIRIEDIVEKVAHNHAQADLDLLRRAYLFSAKEHKGQKRASGESYLVHPLEVANILADMKLDAVCIAAGLLHDVIEDTLTTPEKIREKFGEDVAHIVEGVTKTLGLPPEKVPHNIERYGNTTAGTLPILYHECVQKGMIPDGALVCFTALGSGLHWGAALYRA